MYQQMGHEATFENNKQIGIMATPIVITGASVTEVVNKLQEKIEITDQFISTTHRRTRLINTSEGCTIVFDCYENPGEHNYFTDELEGECDEDFLENVRIELSALGEIKES